MSSWLSPSQELQALRVGQLSQGSFGGAWGGQGPGAAPWDGPAGQPSHSPAADNPPQLPGQPVLDWVSEPRQDEPWSLPRQDEPWSTPRQEVPWSLPPQPPPTSQQPGLAVAQLPAPLQQVDVWQDAMLFRQTGSPAPYSDDDEDSYPSEPEADRLCFYKNEHNDRPPPGAIKVRFTSVNRSGTKSVRVCERCLRWMRKPNAGVKFVLRGSSRGLI